MYLNYYYSYSVILELLATHNYVLMPAVYILSLMYYALALDLFLIEASSTLIVTMTRSL